MTSLPRLSFCQRVLMRALRLLNEDLMPYDDVDSVMSEVRKVLETQDLSWRQCEEFARLTGWPRSVADEALAAVLEAKQAEISRHKQAISGHVINWMNATVGGDGEGAAAAEFAARVEASEARAIAEDLLGRRDRGADTCE